MERILTTVSEVRRETDHATTLRLDLGGADFRYRPGQYIEVDLPPAAPAFFSISSDGLDPRFVEITVKTGGGETGLARFLAHEVKPGHPVAISGPRGRYGLPEAPPAGIDGFLHLCAGSGVTPNHGMIRHALARGWPQRHLLIVQDRTPADALYRDEWIDFAARHAGKFRVFHVYSTSEGRHISPGILRNAMRDWIEPATGMAYVCGPFRQGERPGFSEVWGVLLETLGFARDRIVRELG